MENYVILEAKPIKDIRGTFHIPAYQRGYRWERTQVKTLLNDLYQCMEANGQEKDYCLQPVVVQKKGELQYDLIDGQQRLTTIYILLRYVEQNFFKFVKPEFSFEYETRKKTQAFLDNMDPQLAQTNIDFSTSIRHILPLRTGWRRLFLTTRTARVLLCTNSVTTSTKG